MEQAIEKFLKQNSYKFPKGYPDMKNEDDKKLLYKLLLEIGIDLEKSSIQINKDLI